MNLTPEQIVALKNAIAKKMLVENGQDGMVSGPEFDQQVMAQAAAPSDEEQLASQAAAYQQLSQPKQSLSEMATKVAVPAERQGLFARGEDMDEQEKVKFSNLKALLGGR